MVAAVAETIARVAKILAIDEYESGGLRVEGRQVCLVVEVLAVLLQIETKRAAVWFIPAQHVRATAHDGS